MALLSKLTAFKTEESGAVTVDWVVLTGAIVGLALVVLGTTGKSITGAAVTVSADLVNTQVAATGLNN